MLVRVLSQKFQCERCLDVLAGLFAGVVVGWGIFEEMHSAGDRLVEDVASTDLTICLAVAAGTECSKNIGTAKTRQK